MTDRSRWEGAGSAVRPPAEIATVCVALPSHLQVLVGAGAEEAISVSTGEPVTAARVLDGLEARYPKLKGTIRAHDSGARRAYMRYFAGRIDWSHQAPDHPLPDAVVEGREVFRVLGAIAGG